MPRWNCIDELYKSHPVSFAGAETPWFSTKQLEFNNHCREDWETVAALLSTTPSDSAFTRTGLWCRLIPLLHFGLRCRLAGCCKKMTEMNILIEKHHFWKLGWNVGGYWPLVRGNFKLLHGLREVGRPWTADALHIAADSSPWCCSLR